MSIASPIHAVVYAKDLAALASFYERVLVLARIDEGPSFVGFAGDGYELSVVAIPGDTAAQIVIASPPVPREETPIKLSFLVPSIENLREVVVGAGGSLQAAEAAWSWRGQLHQDGADPEGNVYQLRQLEP